MHKLQFFFVLICCFALEFVTSLCTTCWLVWLAKFFYTLKFLKYFEHIWNMSIIRDAPKVVPDEVQARIFWGQGRFLKIKTQILNSSERLNYMQTLPRASLKHNYPYQIKIILASILTWCHKKLRLPSPNSLVN